MNLTNRNNVPYVEWSKSTSNVEQRARELEEAHLKEAESIKQKKNRLSIS